MLDKLIGFTGLLRRAGVRVSPGETEEFLKAVLLTGLARDKLETAALATLAKGEHEKRVVRKLFDLFFQHPAGGKIISEKCEPGAVLANPPPPGARGVPDPPG